MDPGSADSLLKMSRWAFPVGGAESCLHLFSIVNCLNNEALVLVGPLALPAVVVQRYQLQEECCAGYSHFAVPSILLIGSITAIAKKYISGFARLIF